MRAQDFDGQEDEDRRAARGDVREGGGVQRLLDQLAVERVQHPDGADDLEPARPAQPVAEERHREAPAQMREEPLVHVERAVPSVGERVEERFHCRISDPASRRAATRLLALQGKGILPENSPGWCTLAPFWERRMRRFWRWLKRVSAFRIGLFTGLFFAGLQIFEVAGRGEVPLLTRMEKSLIDLRFKQRLDLKPLRPEGRIVVAAVDEAAIARFGRFPWDRRVLASLVDKLNEQGVTAIGFDMTLSDEDLGGQFAGAKRYRKRFEDISLASPRNQSAVDHFDEAESDLAGAASALASLAHKIKPAAEPVYRAAKGRLDDGHQKLLDSRKTFDDLVKRHEEYAAEMDHDLGGLDPDEVLGEAGQRAAGKTGTGLVALRPGEMNVGDADTEENLERLQRF